MEPNRPPQHDPAAAIATYEPAHDWHIVQRARWNRCRTLECIQLQIQHLRGNRNGREEQCCYQCCHKVPPGPTPERLGRRKEAGQTHCLDGEPTAIRHHAWHAPGKPLESGEKVSHAERQDDRQHKRHHCRNEEDVAVLRTLRAGVRLGGAEERLLLRHCLAIRTSHLADLPVSQFHPCLSFPSQCWAATTTARRTAPVGNRGTWPGKAQLLLISV